MSNLPDLISGEWLQDEDGVFHTVYEARITGAWSGGVSALVTRAGMEDIVAQQAEMGEDADVLAWDGLDVIHTAPALDPDFYAVITPDEDGLYAVPGWTWVRVNPERHEFSGVVG